MKAFGITERSYFHVYGVTIPLKPVTCEQPVSYPSFFLPLWVEHPEVRQDAGALLRTHGGSCTLTSAVGPEGFRGTKEQFGVVWERCPYPARSEKLGRQIPVENVVCVRKTHHEPACLSL